MQRRMHENGVNAFSMCLFACGGFSLLSSASERISHAIGLFLNVGLESIWDLRCWDLRCTRRHSRLDTLLSDNCRLHLQSLHSPAHSRPPPPPLSVRGTPPQLLASIPPSILNIKSPRNPVECVQIEAGISHNNTMSHFSQGLGLKL
jgi:hypothetical protein